MNILNRYIFEHPVDTSVLYTAAFQDYFFSFFDLILPSIILMHFNGPPFHHLCTHLTIKPFL